MAQRKYELKDGITLQPYGVNSLINNENLTDEIAEFLIETGKAELKDFKEINNNKKNNNGNSK